MNSTSRRELLLGVAAALGVGCGPSSQNQPPAPSAQAPPPAPIKLDFPVVDYHVHLGSMTLNQVAATANRRGVKYGVLEHAGKKENRIGGIITDDKMLQDWIAKLEGSGVYKGLQAEFTDWRPCFSKSVLAQVDYTLTDALTIGEAGGKRVPIYGGNYDPGDAEAFMKKYLNWHVEVLEKSPVDIFSHATFLPYRLTQQADQLWTPERMKTIVDALKRAGAALEIDSGMRVPKLPFLRMAKKAGIKFSFGSNSDGGGIAGIDYSIETAQALGLTEKDMFVPAPNGRKPFQTRKLRV